MPELTARSTTQRVGPPGRERRVAPRYPCGREVALRPLGHGRNEVRWASLQNVSRAGAGMLLSCLPGEGSGLVLEFTDRGGKPSAKTLCRVVHLRAQPDGNYQLGCAFERELSEDDLAELLT
jgi:hypothetical protein